MNHNYFSPSPGGVSRREFITTTSVAGAGLLLGASALANGVHTGGGRRKRYAIVGLGARHRMFREGIATTYAEHCEIVGLCDINPGRLRLAQGHLRADGAEAPGFLARDFDRMVREQKPDVIIICTPDSDHDYHMIRSLELGCDVIVEKPMTTDERKCRAILNARRRTGRNIIVTHNYRYAPARTQVKDLLMSGLIGDILSVDFTWLIGLRHGSDYMRRWHSVKAISGGLMVHKATHHFDLVNWWLSAVPVKVHASGKREFFTPAMARRLGLQSHHERCHTCPEAGKCTFHLSLAGNARLKEMYLDQEHYCGYLRDRCVFRPDIDIEDTMHAIVEYDTGATLNFSLNAFHPWAGYVMAFNGTRGRIEHGMQETITVSGTGAVPGELKPEGTYIRVFPFYAPAYAVEVRHGEGAHGGGDKLMMDDLFLPQPQADKYLRRADDRAGAVSILIGAAANRAFVTRRPVRITDLLRGVERPDYTAMPTRQDPVPMPQRPPD